MLDRENIIRDIEKNKIIVILRGFTDEQLIKTALAMEKGGIKLVEVTFDQSGKVSDEKTAESIRMLKDRFSKSVRIGAGTVMTVSTA